MFDFSGVLYYLAYFAVSLVLLVVGIVLFVMTTKFKEFKLISEGNKSAAILVVGRTIGLALVLNSAITNSISIPDLVVWGAIGIVTQIIVNYLVEVLTPTFDIADAIENDNIAVAIALFGMFIALGLIIAGCLTY